MVYAIRKHSKSLRLDDGAESQMANTQKHESNDYFIEITRTFHELFARRMNEKRLPTFYIKIFRTHLFHLAKIKVFT